jgi:2-polyprenyl-6-hydroxyphenyl methylase/3-demethylubiquinone-9 3-methyltransferase
MRNDITKENFCMTKRSNHSVNNAVYDDLNDLWYEAKDNPIALLRAQSALIIPWVAEEIDSAFPGRSMRVLDIGCGGGFLSNALSLRDHVVTGLDLSRPSLDVAARHDATGRVRYIHGDAVRLPFDKASVDVVTAMDFLEHVEDASAVIGEVSRVLVPGGLFLWHTINRNFLSWLVGIKMIEFIFRDVPPDIHVHRLFHKPSEIRAFCEAHSLKVRELRGIRPMFGLRGFISLLTTGIVSDDCAFRFTRSTAITYAGVASKNANA